MYEINWEDREVNFVDICSSKAVKFEDVMAAYAELTRTHIEGKSIGRKPIYSKRDI